MNSGTKPIISICIPTYNRAELLRKALRSILEEFDGIDIEVIVSDNASEDNTEEVVCTYQSNYPCLKYYKNERNIGLDENALACIQKTEGEYVLMFSDDDVFLPGSAKYLLQLIHNYKPSFLYLNHRGFWETQEPDIVYRRKTSPDECDRIYKNGFEMLLDWYPSHFSALVFRRTEAIRHFHRLDEYRQGEYARGYATPNLAHYVLLESPPPFVFVGKCCVAVRNLRRQDYNILHTNTIDITRHCQNLRKKNLLSDSQLRRLANKWALWPSVRIIVRLKGAFDPRFTKKEANLIWQACKGFPLAYLYVRPVLVLPGFSLFVPCYAGLGIQWLYRKITRRSVFE